MRQGIGVHTMQNGYLLFLWSISPEPHGWYPAIFWESVLLFSTPRNSGSAICLEIQFCALDWNLLLYATTSVHQKKIIVASFQVDYVRPGWVGPVPMINGVTLVKSWKRLQLKFRPKTTIIFNFDVKRMFHCFDVLVIISENVLFL